MDMDMNSRSNHDLYILFVECGVILNRDHPHKSQLILNMFRKGCKVALGPISTGSSQVWVGFAKWC